MRAAKVALSRWLAGSHTSGALAAGQTGEHSDEAPWLAGTFVGKALSFARSAPVLFKKGTLQQTQLQFL